MKIEEKREYTFTLTEKEMQFLAICLGTVELDFVKKIVAKENDKVLESFNVCDFYKAVHIHIHKGRN